MSGLEDLLAMIPLDQVAARLGVDPAQADGLVRQALPTLVSGMQANATDPAGASSLAGALGEHDAGLLEGDIDLDQVDESDGQKIISHVFGANQGSVIDQLGGLVGGGDGAGLMSKLLPLLAPIVMSWLAKDLFGGEGDSPLGDLGGLGGMGGLGGSSSSGGLSDLLGGLLQSELGGDSELDSVLGGLLGGGTR